MHRPVGTQCVKSTVPEKGRTNHSIVFSSLYHPAIGSSVSSDLNPVLGTERRGPKHISTRRWTYSFSGKPEV